MNGRPHRHAPGNDYMGCRNRVVPPAEDRGGTPLSLDTMRSYVANCALRNGVSLRAYCSGRGSRSNIASESAAEMIYVCNSSTKKIANRRACAPIAYFA